MKEYFSRICTYLILLKMKRTTSMKKLILSLEAIYYILLGGIIYYFIEILFRGYSHYSMFLCGGIIFYCISLFHRRYDSLHLITKMIMCSFIITVIELTFGIIFNIWLKQGVWNYTDQYFHFKGQICLTFSILWFFLSLPALYLEKKIRLFFHS